MVAYGERKAFSRVPDRGELRVPISIARMTITPNTSNTNTRANRKLDVYRNTKAKMEVAEIKTTGVDEGYLVEQSMVFTVRKKPNIEMEKKIDFIIYRDKLFMIQEYIEIDSNDRQKNYTAIITTEVQDIDNVTHTKEKQEEIADNKPTNPGFFL